MTARELVVTVQGKQPGTVRLKDLKHEVVAHVHAAVRKGRVGIGELQWRYFTTAKGQRQTVEVETTPESCLDSHAMSQIDGHRHAHEVERLDSRDVVGAGQCLSGADRAMELAAAVLGHILGSWRARSVVAHLVIENNCSREHATVKGGRIDNWHEGRARLSLRICHVELT